MTNSAHILETALLLLAAYLVGCVLGYAVRRILYAARGTRQVTPVAVLMPAATAPISGTAAKPVRRRTPAARLAATASDDAAALPVAAIAKPVPASARRPSPKPKLIPADPRPMALSAPRSGGADNLKQIKGIGPKIESSLNALGIYHLDQIAAWTKSNVDWIDDHLAFKGRIRREQWVEQAVELTRVGA